VPVTSKEMKNISNHSKIKNSCGYDEISSKVLKSSMPFVLSPLIYICNKSLATGIFPSWLKYSQVHPIYKKGERSEISNYRPICTSFSKIFEKVILIDCSLIYLLIISWILISMDLGKIALWKLLPFNLISNILQALNSKKLVGGVFCDLRHLIVWIMNCCWRNWIFMVYKEHFSN
jgi:hypothetical protein